MTTRTTAETAGSGSGSAAGSASSEAVGSAAPRGGRLTAFVRVSIALQTVAIFFQAVTSGIAMSAPYGEVLHSAGARGMYAASMLYVLAAVLAWRPGGGSARPILYSTGFLLLASLQVVLGIAHVMGVHLPLGVLMFGLSLLDLGRVAFGRPRPVNPGHAASLS